MLKRQVERACRPESMKQCQPTMPHAMPSVKERQFEDGGKAKRYFEKVGGGGTGLELEGTGKIPAAKRSKASAMIYGVQHNEL